MQNERSPEPSVHERTLYATRALGIFFIRSAVATLVGGAIIVGGTLILMYGGVQATALGVVVVVLGAIVSIVWEIIVLVTANHELRKSGAIGLGEWLGSEIQ